MTKRGLAVIYDPHNLYQFVWYYCNKGKEKEWDALCLPNGYKGEYMHTYCEVAGIFQQIYKGDTDFSILPMWRKLKIFAGMFLYFVTGRRTEYCKKLINQYVNEANYDEFVVIADVGIISGACVALGKEKEVVILEDGTGDYSERPIFIPKERIRSGDSWQGFVLSRMGYCSPGWFRLKSDENCIKYCSRPEKMKYRGYKEIRQLYTNKGTDTVLFDEIIRKVYPTLNNYNFSECDSVLLTRPLDDFVTDGERYKKRIETYISKNYKSLLLKRHPRDSNEYSFGENVRVTEVDNSIPLEALLGFLKGREVLVVTAGSSISMQYMRDFDIKCVCLFMEGLYEESLYINSREKPSSYKEVDSFCKEYLEGYYKIVKI